MYEVTDEHPGDLMFSMSTIMTIPCCQVNACGITSISFAGEFFTKDAQIVKEKIVQTNTSLEEYLSLDAFMQAKR